MSGKSTECRAAAAVAPSFSVIAAQTITNYLLYSYWYMRLNNIVYSTCTGKAVEKVALPLADNRENPKTNCGLTCR